ncbi:MAG: ABC transporter ATP-binding protein [Planctomycetes bacterium]|nr:ABC transporter ATP-binding protein [Planctomycetota bacterium]
MAKTDKNLAIETAGLTKVFRDFWGHQKVLAVDRLDLDVPRHQVYGLLGPNGSGKSTTIKMLLGLLFATRGVARVLGRSPGDIKTNARIGYLPEESHLYPYLSARETLDFYGRLFSLGNKVRQKRIDSLLDMVGLSGVGRRPMGEFSKGMARRLGLAQALINDPDLLILDEPTSGLDPLGTRQIKDLVMNLGRRGKTVLLCSHLLADVEDVCDQIGILYGGKMQAEGKVGDLLARQEMTQIRSGRLSDEAVGKIKDIIKLENQDYQLEVKVPQDRLEDYFLRIVEQARAADTATSGAVIGSGVSDFLSAIEEPEDEPEVVIERLVVGKEPQASEAGTGETEPVAPISMTPVEEETRQVVLDSLVATESVEAAVSGKTEDGSDLTKPVDKVSEVDVNESGSMDRSLIDELTTGLGGSQEQEDSKKAAKPDVPDSQSKS